MNQHQHEKAVTDDLKKLDKALDKGFRVVEWAVFAVFAAIIGYVAYHVLGFLYESVLIQWGGAALIGLFGSWLVMKILKVLSWLGVG